MGRPLSQLCAGGHCRTCRDPSAIGWRRQAATVYEVPGDSDIFECPHGKPWNTDDVIPPSDRRSPAAVDAILTEFCESCPHSVAGDHDKLGCRRVSPNGCCPGKLRAHLAGGGGCPEKLFGEVL